MYKKTIITFVSLIALFSIVSVVAVQYEREAQDLQMERLILENEYTINKAVSQQLFLTRALAALVVHGDGSVANFQETAAVMIASETTVANFLLAPGGVVSDVYPLEENKAVIGLDLLDPTAQEGNKEAIQAYEIDDLVMAGPFTLRQGFTGLVGRYPVYIESESGESEFWGLVSVTLKFPQALNNTGLSGLEKQGYFYELWRNNPDTGERQVIASNTENFDSSREYLEKPIDILNAEWYLRLYPTTPWHANPVMWLLFAAGLAISFLCATVVQYSIRLKEESRISIMLSQIQPHFLYNAISSIRNLCREDPVSAKEAFDRLTGYLRANLDSLSLSAPIMFEKELEHVKTYLSIETIRFEDRLTIIYDISVTDFLIPALTVQPLVENAVKHGITKREEGGTLTIKTEDTDSAFVITVADDGVGFDKSRLDNKHKHVGIDNARSRLMTMSGGKLVIHSEPGAGATAVITIPKRKEKPGR